MKKMILLLTLFFLANGMFAQKAFKIGMVKGKNVTYEVREKKNFKGKNVPFDWIIRNIYNPDTLIKPIPQRSIKTPQETDICMRIAEIIHSHLSPEELMELGEKKELFSVILRADRDKYKLLQVTCFNFENRYIAGLRKSPEEQQFYPKSYDGFWLNFDPDRLHEIEKNIVKRVKLPKKLHETFLTDDFWAVVRSGNICNVEKTREERKKAIEAWKELDLIKIDNYGPPLLY